MIKYLLLLISFTVLFTTVSSNAQLIQKDNGKYYNKNNELYTGTYIEYYPTGEKHIEMNLTGGQKNGKTIIYFENAGISEIRSFKNDLMDGTWETFNLKAIKIAEANYKEGIKHGKWYIWDDNGVMRYEMEYTDGIKTGTWKIWDENSKLVEEKKYTE